MNMLFDIFISDIFMMVMFLGKLVRLLVNLAIEGSSACTNSDWLWEGWVIWVHIV